MDAERRMAVTRWLRDQGIRDASEISSAEHAELLSLLPHKGFGIFWSLIMFERQQAAQFLNNLNLATQEGASIGSQLQGQIKAVDGWMELLLNIADPMGDGSETQV